MDQQKKALVVSTYREKGEEERALEYAEELALLAKTYGLEVIAQTTSLIRKIEAGTFFSKGKLAELVALKESAQANIVLFDDEMTPAQEKNLEKAFSCPIMDRRQVILGVFAKRARTKEAVLQIELARLKYELPRLKRMWTHLSRQRTGGSGGGYLKGEGEKQIEIDRQILKRNIAAKEREIELVRKSRSERRKDRLKNEVPVFALIGYTNVGKSTLFNTLTGADVFAEDKLFSTLDTTTRKFLLPNNQKILLIDTVGFIKKLPHQLVAAFRSTLEEVAFADVLVHVIDVSDKKAEEEAAITLSVLKELGIVDRPMFTVLNKIDRAQKERVMRFRTLFPKVVEVSALERLGLVELQELMMEELKGERVHVELLIPQSDYGLVSAILEQGEIDKKEYRENTIYLSASIPRPLKWRVTHYEV